MEKKSFDKNQIIRKLKKGWTLNVALISDLQCAHGNSLSKSKARTINIDI